MDKFAHGPNGLFNRNLRIDPINNPNRTAAFVADKAHPHTTIQGLFANMALEAFGLGYETQVPLFTEEEILNHAGVAYGGADSLAGQITDWAEGRLPLVQATGCSDIYQPYVTPLNASMSVTM